MELSQNILTGDLSLLPGKCLEVFLKFLSDKIFGAEATSLYNDAQKLVEKIVEEKWFTANGVIGFWPAISNNADTDYTCKQKKVK